MDYEKTLEKLKHMKVETGSFVCLGCGHEHIESFFQNAPAEARPLWFLGKSLELLATADVAYFAPGWEDARGCRVEHTCAVEYGVPTIITA